MILEAKKIIHNRRITHWGFFGLRFLWFDCVDRARPNHWDNLPNNPMGQFFCVGLGCMFYLLCLDSCLQTYVLRKMKTARFMLCLS